MTGSMISVPNCCATRTSLTRAEIVMLTETAIQASSGVKMSWDTSGLWCLVVRTPRRPGSAAAR